MQLTEHQTEVWKWVLYFFKINDRLPTTREMASNFKWNSQTSAMRFVNIFVREGLLAKSGRYYKFGGE